MDYLNTHYYDGKIDTSLLPKLKDFSVLSLEEKKETAEKLRSKVKSSFSSLAMKYLNHIIFDIGTNSNIDTTNNLTADDLICYCWSFKDNNDFIKELEVQLEDMNTGFCQQGRTHRLFQLLKAYN